MVKIHEIEDYLLNQIKKYNGTGCFIEDFIEQAHQFGMLDEKITANMKDRVKVSFNHSKMESISNNSEVKFKKDYKLEWRLDEKKKRKLMDVKRKTKSLG